VSLRTRLRKADWLGEMQAALMLGTGAVGVAITVVVWEVVTGAPMVSRVPAEAIAGMSGSSAGLTGAMVAADSMVEVRIAEPSTSQVIAHALTTLPGLLVVLVMLAMLARIVRAARRADPFTGQTVRRLRVLAISILVGGVLASVVETIAEFNLSLSVTPGSISAQWALPGQWMLLGFGFLAVAEVINRGAMMRAELDTVI
jgi:hypothetical protein